MNTVRYESECLLRTRRGVTTHHGALEIQLPVFLLGSFGSWPEKLILKRLPDQIGTWLFCLPRGHCEGGSRCLHFIGRPGEGSRAGGRAWVPGLWPGAGASLPSCEPGTPGSQPAGMEQFLSHPKMIQAFAGIFFSEFYGFMFCLCHI